MFKNVPAESQWSHELSTVGNCACKQVTRKERVNSKLLRNNKQKKASSQQSVWALVHHNISQSVGGSDELAVSAQRRHQTIHIRSACYLCILELIRVMNRSAAMQCPQEESEKHHAESMAAFPTSAFFNESNDFCWSWLAEVFIHIGEIKDEQCLPVENGNVFDIYSEPSALLSGPSFVTHPDMRYFNACKTIALSFSTCPNQLDTARLMTRLASFFVASAC